MGWNRDTCLLPLVGAFLMLPAGLLIVSLLWETFRGWPTWLAASVFALATVLISCASCIVGIHVATWWRRRRGDDR